ncbi:hypothetical protein scyTo_0020961, partial [Scyliorhinus torazame]|nr:hypothetical protein [Scyliorhinus torazame]
MIRRTRAVIETHNISKPEHFAAPTTTEDDPNSRAPKARTSNRAKQQRNRVHHRPRHHNRLQRASEEQSQELLPSRRILWLRSPFTKTEVAVRSPRLVTMVSMASDEPRNLDPSSSPCAKDNQLCVVRRYESEIIIVPVLLLGASFFVGVYILWMICRRKREGDSEPQR